MTAAFVRNLGTRFFEIVRGKLVEVGGPEDYFERISGETGSN